MIRILLFTVFVFGNTNLFCQPKGLTEEIVDRYGIKRVVTHLDMESDDARFENLKVRTFEFNQEGKCIHKKLIYPFYDVVTTSNEYFVKYDKKGKLLEQISIYSRGPITKKDKEYIGLFGETKDTTIRRFQYDKFNRILQSIKFEVGSIDTIITQYQYKDSFKLRTLHFNTQSKGTLYEDNFMVEYFYDDLDRVSQENKTPETLSQFSTTEYKYLENTEKIVEKKTINPFSWMHSYKYGKKSIEVTQDSINGSQKIKEYDENNNLVKWTSYRSFPNLETNFHGKNYRYSGNLMVEEQSFNKSEEVFNLTDKIEYLYDSKGLLIEEKMIYNDELKYIYKFQYELKN